MLTDLLIKNFAIIENLHVTFGPGFNVLTGETGAGKSIIIDAVNLLLGGRARGEVIRTGEEEASVEAVFDLTAAAEINSLLEEFGLAVDGELMVRRILSRSGKNRIFVNGSPVPLAQLRELTGGLVNIYGQHEHQNLQRTETHLEFLDDFAGLGNLLTNYRAAFETYGEIRKKLENLNLAERERQQRIDLLSFQKRELEDARLQSGEDIELEQERSLLLHAEKLTLATRGGYDTLYAGNDALCGRLSGIIDSLEALQQIDPAFVPLVETLQNSQYALEDIATELRDYAEKLDFEPHRQQQVEDRLAILTGLKRKYAPTLEELIAYQQQISRELEDLADVAGRRDELETRLNQCKQDLLACGGRLSKERRQAAEKLAADVEDELGALAMPKARFSVKFTELAEPTGDGLERGEFYLAANPGEEAQPLARIASGGELSRIMLALRRSVPAGDSVSTLIFDEVDAGIGGEAATAVGEKISRLGERLQVLCVTHLPQVAAFADRHYRVAKLDREGRTVTHLERLEESARVAEMARMLGGSQVGERTLEHARELISGSRARLGR